MRDIDAHCLEIAVSVLTVTGDLHGGWCVIPKPSIDGGSVGVSVKVWNVKRRFWELLPNSFAGSKR